MGLGAGRKSEVEEDTDRPRIGIGGLSNTFAQFFAASSSSHATVVQMASTATQAIQHPVTTATSNEGYSGEKETTEKQRRRAKKKEERKGRNADEIPEVEVEVEVEKKKLKGVKRKTGGAKLSDLTLSTAVEEPEGGLESDSKRRREDKKKKRAKHDI
jgi:Pin2-interacting protein X1